MASALAVLGLVILVVLATLQVRRRIQGFFRERRFARARRLEDKAQRVLRRSGFVIAGRKVRRRVWLEVDGEREAFVVEADYLVRGLAEELLVAEVKTGTLAPRATYMPTRRQLLEYDLAFAEAEGLLLVDMEQERVAEVRFPTPDEIVRSLSL